MPHKVICPRAARNAKENDPLVGSNVEVLALERARGLRSNLINTSLSLSIYAFPKMGQTLARGCVHACLPKKKE